MPQETNQNKTMTIQPMENPPQEVRDIVQRVQDSECRQEYYERLNPIAWVKTDDPIKARKVLDLFYQELEPDPLSKAVFGVKCRLVDGVEHMTRANPVELRVNNWWVLCGLDFD